MQWTVPLAAFGTAVALVLFVWGIATGFGVFSPIPSQTVFVRGQVVRVQAPGGLDLAPVVQFAVGAVGGQFTGAVHWDHSSAVFLLLPEGTVINCPAEFFGLAYSGSGWNQSWNQSLSPGVYVFGAICDGYGNATVTDTIQLVSL